MERIVYLALGGREGDPRTQMLAGLARLWTDGVKLSKASSLWETEPVGIPEGPPVLNAAVEVRTDLSAREILLACRRAEDASGRKRLPPEWRSLDVDILLDGGLVLNDDDLVIPHPRFHERRFNLEPLAEIAPRVVHPRIGATISEILRGCADTAWARKLEPPSWALFVERLEAVR